jgi:selenocysteine lyase/cysteine desulfurase
VHNFNDAFILAQFPQDPDLCYLNHAAVSPWPKCTEEAITQFAKENVYQGARDYPQWMEKEKSLRSLLAQLLNVEGSSEIALAKSTSEALSTIAYGIHWKEVSPWFDTGF